jgi:hypothetical protein
MGADGAGYGGRVSSGRGAAVPRPRATESVGPGGSAAGLPQPGARTTARTHRATPPAPDARVAASSGPAARTGPAPDASRPTLQRGTPQEVAVRWLRERRDALRAAVTQPAGAIGGIPFMMPAGDPPTLSPGDARSRYRGRGVTAPPEPSLPPGGAGPSGPPGSSASAPGAPGPQPITARLGMEGLVPPPTGSGTVQRSGLQLSLMLGGHQLAVRIWKQTGDAVPPELPLPPARVEVFDRRGPIDSVARLLADRLPPGFAWRVMHVPPLPVGLAKAVGVEQLSSIAVRVDDAVASGAVLYDPQTGRLRLNLRETPEGPSLVAPLDVDVVEARGVAPTEVTGLPPLPLHPILSGEVLKSWHLRLSGPIDAQLAGAITRGLNQRPLGREFWWLPGADAGVVAKGRIRFAHPGTFPIGGVFRLPKDWPGLASGLMPGHGSPDQPRKPEGTAPAPPGPIRQRAMPVLMGAKPENATRPPPDEVLPSRWGGLRFGFEGVVRFGVQAFRQEVKPGPAPRAEQPYTWPAGVERRPPTADPARLNAWPPGALSAPEAHARPLPTRVFLPAIDAEVSSRIRPLQPDPATTDDDALARVEARAEFTLAFPGPDAPTLRISGSVLNALHGYPVHASDLPALGRFLRSLDPTAVQRGDAPRRDVAPVLSFNAAVVYEAMQAFEPGQPMPPPIVRRLWQAIETYARSLPSGAGQFNLPGR